VLVVSVRCPDLALVALARSSYLDERLPEARAALSALGIAPSDLQLETERRATTLEELAEVIATGLRSAAGNDEEFLRHTLCVSLPLSLLSSPASLPELTGARSCASCRSFHDSRIARLKASGQVSSPRPAPGSAARAHLPPASRISSLLSNGAVPSSAHSLSRTFANPAAPHSPSLAARAAPPQHTHAAPQQQQQYHKASSVTSGTDSQHSATLATLAARKPAPAPAPAPAPQLSRAAAPQPAPEPALVTPAPASRFRAAGATTGASTSTPSLASARAPPAASAPARAPAPVPHRAQPPQPSAEDVDALLDGVDFDEDEDSLEIVEPPPPRKAAPPQGQRHAAGRGLGIGIGPAPGSERQGRAARGSGAEVERMVLDEPPQQAAQGQGRAKEQRTVSTASDVVIQEAPRQQQQQQQQQAVASTSKAVVPVGAAAALAPAAQPQRTYPWTKDVYKALRQRFGLRSFRANQEEAINATLSGRDVFVLLPTGGGKSLCFQLPAVVSSGKTRGVSIVVSPLLSLISDQTRALTDKDIPVVFLNSTMPAADKKFALSCLRSDPPMACLAYVTPEQVRPSSARARLRPSRLPSPLPSPPDSRPVLELTPLSPASQIVKSAAFRDLLSDLHRRRQLARFVIDEAHCVSSWGHDFRAFTLSSRPRPRVPRPDAEHRAARRPRLQGDGLAQARLPGRPAHRAHGDRQRPRQAGRDDQPRHGPAAHAPAVVQPRQPALPRAQEDQAHPERHRRLCAHEPRRRVRHHLLLEQEAVRGHGRASAPRAQGPRRPLPRRASSSPSLSLSRSATSGSS